MRNLALATATLGLLLMVCTIPRSEAATSIVNCDYGNGGVPLNPTVFCDGSWSSGSPSIDFFVLTGSAVRLLDGARAVAVPRSANETSTIGFVGRFGVGCNGFASIVDILGSQREWVFVPGPFIWFPTPAVEDESGGFVAKNAGSGTGIICIPIL